MNALDSLIARLKQTFAQTTFVTQWPAREDNLPLPFAVLQELASHDVNRNPTIDPSDPNREVIAERRATCQLTFFFRRQEQEQTYKDLITQAFQGRKGQAGSIEGPDWGFRTGQMRVTTNEASLKDGTRSVMVVLDGSWIIYRTTDVPNIERIQLTGKISENPKELDL